MPHNELTEGYTPAALAALSDELGTKRAERLAADKVAAALATEESRLSGLLLLYMRENQLTSIGGALHTVTVASEPDLMPAVKDWGAYWEYAVANNAPEMFERRPGKLACRERWEAGEEIPGVEKFPVYKLTVKGVK